ncbi:MAG: hypothetical protein ACFFEK_12420 [Candidatus Thorarchaeota archaeon]
MRKRELSSVILIVLFLLPGFAYGLDVDKDLVVGTFYAAHREATAGWRIEGSFSTNYDIEFFICDEDNYTSWDRHQSVFLFEHSEETRGFTFNFTIPYDSDWYVVFSNVGSQGTISLEAEIHYIDQFDVDQTQITWFTQTIPVTPLLIGVLAMFSIVCLFGVWISRRSEEIPAVDYDKILPKPD